MHATRPRPAPARHRRLLPGLILILWLALVQPERAGALHPPPAFVAGPDNPFGLADVGSLSTPSFADLDGDGDLDAFIGESGGNTRFFENTGTAGAPAFAAAVDNPFGLTDVGFYSAPSFADLDGDGDLDAFIGEITGDTKFFENTGSGIAPAFAAVIANPFGLADVGSFSKPSFADLDGDGDLDALIGENLGDTRFFENTGSGVAPAFAAALVNPFGLADIGNLGAPSFADLDGDGDLDAFIGENLGNTRFFENTGTATSPAFAAPVDNPFGLADIGADSTPSFADLDGDGDLDALIGEGGGATKFFENTRGSASPDFAASYVFADTGRYSAPRFADLDGDGDLDAFVGDLDGDTSFFENTGTAVSSAFAAPVENPFGLAGVGTTSIPSFADLDGDGDLDAFFGELMGNTVFFENTGTAVAPAFAASNTNPFGLANVGSLSAPAFADLDGDGDLDALIGRSDGRTRFFRNTGTAVAPAFAGAVVNAFGLGDVGDASNPTFADLDGDGDLDAIIGENNGSINVFENTTPVPVELMAFEIE